MSRTGKLTAGTPALRFKQTARHGRVARVVQRTETPAHIAFLDRIAADLPGELTGERVRTVAWRPTERLAGVVAPPGHARIFRRAPNDAAADLLCHDATNDQPREVRVRQPGREHAGVGRFREAGADADEDALDAVLEPIQPSHEFAVRLRQAIKSVRKELRVVADRLRSLMEADGMVG